MKIPSNNDFIQIIDQSIDHPKLDKMEVEGTNVKLPTNYDYKQIIDLSTNNHIFRIKEVKDKDSAEV